MPGASIGAQVDPPPPGYRRRIGRWVARALFVVVLSALVFLFFPAVGHVSNNALSYSVTREVGGSVMLGVSPCRQREDVYLCDVADEQNSGSATYRVRRSGRCWTAVHTQSYGQEGSRLDKRADACVKLRDQIRLFDRI